jgi:KDO2-lipid IV(A) lauroyltransferase
VKRKHRRWLALLLTRTLIVVSRLLPRRMGLAFFSALGALAFRLYEEERERTKTNLALAFAGTDPMIIEAMAKSSFIALGRNVYDALRLVFLERGDMEGLCTISGEHHLRESYERGNGVIALTGHIGCWELLAACFSGKGYKVSVIARSLHDERLNDILVNMRLRHGIVSIPRVSGAITGYKALKKGEILGMLIDQDIDVDGVMVPFFGVPAYTARGAAVYALKSGADIVPMAIHLQPDGRHRITVMPQLEPPPERLGEEQRVVELTAACSEAVEKLIRLYPQQWVWFHERWKRYLKESS